MMVLKKGKGETDLAFRSGETEDRKELKRGEGIILDMRWFLELLQ